ncbi:MAG TPA: PCRF domain-containing protein, partial [Longimicrobiales bacterium]|nr:PCRF domain-containing protein [Longimicrobiales bacterium]
MRRSEAIFDVEKKKRELAALEEQMGASGFWDNPQAAREVIATANELKTWVEPYQAILTKTNDLDELATLLETDADAG